MTTPPFEDFLSPEIIAQGWGHSLNLRNWDRDAKPMDCQSSAPEEWWGDLPIVNISIIAGGKEMLRDDIVIVGEALKVCC